MTASPWAFALGVMVKVRSEPYGSMAIPSTGNSAGLDDSALILSWDELQLDIIDQDNHFPGSILINGQVIDRFDGWRRSCKAHPSIFRFLYNTQPCSPHPRCCPSSRNNRTDAGSPPELGRLVSRTISRVPSIIFFPLLNTVADDSCCDILEMPPCPPPSGRKTPTPS